MTLTDQAATGRFYDLGGVPEAPVPSRVGLQLAGWNGWTMAEVPVNWALSTATPPAVWGLMRPVVSATSTDHGRPLGGIEMLGDGLVTITLRFDGGGIGGPPAVALVTSRMYRNGAVEQEQIDSEVQTHNFYVFHFDMTYEPVDVPVSAGDIFTAAFQFGYHPALAVFPSGTGQQTGFGISGNLTPPGLTPGQPPMGLHGAVVDSY